MGIFIHILGTTVAISIKISNALTLYQFILQSGTHTKGECAGVFSMLLLSQEKTGKKLHVHQQGPRYMNHSTSIQRKVTQQ